jgi:hypothetical protein
MYCEILPLPQLQQGNSFRCAGGQDLPPLPQKPYYRQENEKVRLTNKILISELENG